MVTAASVRRHWQAEWLDTFGVVYELRDGDAGAFATIAETFGDRAETVVSALIKDPSLDWVTSRTPRWLANTSNHAYLTRFLRGAPVRGDSEWRGPRTPGRSVVVRHAGRAAR